MFKYFVISIGLIGLSGSSDCDGKNPCGLRNKIAQRAVTMECLNSSEELNKSIVVNDSNVQIELAEQSNGDVIVSVETLSSNLFLIWYDGQYKSNVVTAIDCLALLSKQVRVTNVLANTGYTFCVMDKFSPTISPFNCISHYLKSSKLDNMWISTDSKAMTIGLTILCMILTIILGFFIGILIIRKNPILLRGSKRVVVVDSNRSTISSSITTGTRLSKSSSIDKRRSSTSSTASAKSYVEAVSSSRFDDSLKISNKIDNVRKENLYYSKNMSAHMTPPPLPPPNPRNTVEQLIYEVPDEVDDLYYGIN